MAPRLRLTYPLELSGETHQVEVPVVVGVIGEFALVPPTQRRPLRERRFQRLEADDLSQWRAVPGASDRIQRLAPLVALAEAHPWICVRVLDASRDELARDFDAAPVIDDSALWQKVFRDEFCSFGGEPYALLLVDFAFTADPADLDVLRCLARVGADAACPVMAAAAPAMFAAATWDAIPDAERLDALFAARPHAGWQGLRDSDEARFLALAVQADAIDTGAALLRAHAATGLWTGGAPDADTMAQPEAERLRDAALARHGFLVAHAPLRKARNAQRPRRYHQPQAAALAVLTSHLAHVLTSAQFLRTVTCVARDAIGVGSMTELEATLNRWLQGHVDGGGPSDAHGPGTGQPLAEARVQLHDLVSSPGAIEAVLHLRIDLPGVQSALCARYAMRSVGYR